MTTPQFNEVREYVINTFQADIDDASIERLAFYLKELFIWNQKFNLIAPCTEEEAMWRHFADSLSCLKFINTISDETNIIDLGAGAGFPGMVLKAVRPQIKLSLVESIGKKCDFLRHIAKTLSLENVNVLNARAETLGQDSSHREQYDFAVSRAFCKLSANLEMTLPFVKPSGSVIIYKTEESAQEAFKTHFLRVAQILGAEAPQSFTYKPPTLQRAYSLIAYKKVYQTPPIYPRNVGIVEKRPL